MFLASLCLGFSMLWFRVHLRLAGGEWDVREK